MACSYLPICHRFKGDCVDPMSQCHLGQSCLSVCVPPSGSAVMEGGTCKYINDCGESQICNLNAPDGDGKTMGKCRYLCTPGMTGGGAGKGGCPATQKCTAVK